MAGIASHVFESANPPQTHKMQSCGKTTNSAVLGQSVKPSFTSGDGHSALPAALAHGKTWEEGAYEILK